MTIIPDLIAVGLATASTIGANRAIHLFVKKTFDIDLERVEWPNQFIKWAVNPLFACVYCMASVWGGTMFILWGGGVNHLIPAMLAINGLIWYFATE